MKLEETQAFQHRVLALIASIHPPPPADPTSESGAVFGFLEFLRSCSAVPGLYALITSGAIRAHLQIFSTGNFPTLGSEDVLLTHVHDLERQASVEGRGMSIETACAYYKRYCLDQKPKPGLTFQTAAPTPHRRRIRASINFWACPKPILCWSRMALERMVGEAKNPLDPKNLQP